MVKGFFSKMLRIPKIGKNNEIGRKQWIEEKLQAIPNGYRLLDAGAGELANKHFCDHLEYISQDFCQYDGKGNASGLQTNEWDTSGIDIVCDIVDIPEVDESFDIVLCSEVLEHVPNPELAIKEFSRLLKKDGSLIITAPFCSLTHFSPYHYVTGFNRYYYMHVLDKYGFELKELTPNGNYYEYIAQEIRRLGKMASEYSESSLGVTDNIKIWGILKLLQKLNKKNRGSEELLCFGYHVLAQKKS